MMELPEHLQRYPTRAAIKSLAERFDFPNHPGMQDWEYEVADPARIDEFIAAYESGELDEDERFTLMETLLESFEEQETELEDDKRWHTVLGLIETHIDLHISTVWYWSDLENDDLELCFRITPFMRAILERHKHRFIEHER